MSSICVCMCNLILSFKTHHLFLFFFFALVCFLSNIRLVYSILFDSPPIFFSPFFLGTRQCSVDCWICFLPSTHFFSSVSTRFFENTHYPRSEWHMKDLFGTCPPERKKPKVQLLFLLDFPHPASKIFPNWYLCLISQVCVCVLPELANWKKHAPYIRNW